MQHLVQFAANVLYTPGTTNNHYSGYVPSVAAKGVIVRLGYEFDGGWNPYGNLNVMSNVPNNYIQSWRNIVTTVCARHPNRVKDLCIGYPDKVRVSDLTSVALGSGFVYLAVIMGVFTRSIRGWSLSRSLDGDLCLVALVRALVWALAVGTPVNRVD